MNTNYQNLRQFFGGYFHQDWNLEGDDWEEIVAAFVSTADRGTLLKTCDEIEHLIQETMGEDELSKVLFDLGSCCRPDGSNRDWIRAIQERIVAGIK
jgi:CdiI immunity protein